MRITIEAEPKEMAAIVLELQKQPGGNLLNMVLAEQAFDQFTQDYINKLNLRNPKIAV